MKLITLGIGITLFIALELGCGRSEPPAPTVNVPITTSQTTAPPQNAPINTNTGETKKTGDKGTPVAETREKPSPDIFSPVPPAQPVPQNVPPNPPTQPAPQPAPQNNAPVPVVVPPPADKSANKSKEDVLEREADVSGTSAANAAEAAARASSPGKGIQPAGSKLFYTPEDLPRIVYYKGFLDDTFSADNVVRKIFGDPDPNRTVAVLGDLYWMDKGSKNLPSDIDLKFQELGQKVGNSFSIYNKAKSEKYATYLKYAVGGGLLLGALAGGVAIEGDEWINPWINSRLGKMTPIYVKNAALVGLSAGTAIFVSGGTLLLLRSFIFPKSIYNADPLLDAPH